MNSLIILFLIGVTGIVICAAIWCSYKYTCQHQWDEPTKTGVIQIGSHSIGSFYDARCKKCGEIRRFTCSVR